MQAGFLSSLFFYSTFPSSLQAKSNLPLLLFPRSGACPIDVLFDVIRLNCHYVIGVSASSRMLIRLKMSHVKCGFSLVRVKHNA
jgi:hypothetical protein